MHPSKMAQIAYLKVDKALTKVLNKYINFTDIISSKLTVEFTRYIGINDYTIELVDN